MLKRLRMGCVAYHLHLLIMDEGSVGVFDITLQFSSRKRWLGGAGRCVSRPSTCHRGAVYGLTKLQKCLIGAVFYSFLWLSWAFVAPDLSIFSCRSSRLG